MEILSKFLDIRFLYIKIGFTHYSNKFFLNLLDDTSDRMSVFVTTDLSCRSVQHLQTSYRFNKIISIFESLYLLESG